MAKDPPRGPLYFSLWLFRQLCLGVAVGGVIGSGVAAVVEGKDWTVVALVLALYALGMAALSHWALRMVGEEKASREERGGGKG
jgi:hypothetical protein